MKSLGSLHYFLGIEILPHSKGLFLSQSKYIADVLHRLGLEECKPVPTPASVKPPPLLSSKPFHNPSLYRSMVDSLQYMTITRPEISFSVNSLGQKMHCPTEADFLAVKRIFRFLKGTVYHGLVFQPSLLHITAFLDSDWAANKLDRRSISGSCIFLGNNPVMWSSKKQKRVAKSSTEA